MQTVKRTAAAERKSRGKGNETEACGTCGTNCDWVRLIKVVEISAVLVPENMCPVMLAVGMMPEISGFIPLTGHMKNGSKSGMKRRFIPLFLSAK